MIEVVLQGQTLKANLLNPEVSKRYEDGFDKVIETFNEAKKCERGSDGIRMQCQAVIDYVTDIFGEEQAKKCSEKAQISSNAWISWKKCMICLRNMLHQR